MTLYRFGVAVERNLVDEFDRLAKKAGYVNRSEAIRDLMRNFVIEKKSEFEDIPVVGSITIVYDHTKRTPDKLTEYQHGHHDEIIATMHIHLDEDHCLEVIAVRGDARQVRKIADELMSMKGVLHGKLVITASPPCLTE